MKKSIIGTLVLQAMEGEISLPEVYIKDTKASVTRLPNINGDYLFSVELYAVGDSYE